LTARPPIPCCLHGVSSVPRVCGRVPLRRRDTRCPRGATARGSQPARASCPPAYAAPSPAAHPTETADQSTRWTRKSPWLRGGLTSVRRYFSTLFHDNEVMPLSSRRARKSPTCARPMLAADPHTQALPPLWCRMRQCPTDSSRDLARKLFPADAAAQKRWLRRKLDWLEHGQIEKPAAAPARWLSRSSVRSGSRPSAARVNTSSATGTACVIRISATASLHRPWR
jgi:hypothetical protein